LDHDVVVPAVLGTIRTLARYPVKSMAGETLARCAVDAAGLAGDRRFGIVDDDGRVASAKQPRRWAGLLSIRASYDGAPSAASLRVALPDGRELGRDDAALTAELSAMAGRPVRLAEAPISRALDVRIERIATEFDKEPGAVGDIPIGLASAPGLLFDLAPLHLVTQATLDALGADARRFRPNLVLDSPTPAFGENAWVNQRVRIGPSLTMLVIAATPRCVIPTLAQSNLAGDPTLLKRINAANRVDVPLVGPSPCVGVYAVPLTPGDLSVGDELRTS
jgi:uncharacterized protein YcbX